MIIVTGLPRSGTSLMMRILETLSVPITGEQFFNRGDQDRVDRSHYLNPEGFYELQGTVATGKFKDPSSFVGKAVKVIVPGVLNIPLDHIEKIIFCLRDPSEVMESQRNLVSNIEVATEDGKKYAPELLQRSFRNYIHGMGMLILIASEDFWNKTLVVEHKNLMSNHVEEIQKISSFLNVPFVDKNLVKNELYRSKAVIEADPLALEIYNSIKLRDFAIVKDKIKTWFENQNLQNVRWVDESEFQTFAMSNLSLHKSLVSNNKGVRDKLIESSKNTKHYFDCPYYSRNGEEYTIKRIGLPDLIRKKVTCSHFKEEKTLEFCHQHFMGLSLQGIMKK